MHEHVVKAATSHVRDLASGVASNVPWTAKELAARLVEDTQQALHDTLVDTTWPVCPLHANHPLWYAHGDWYCPRTSTAIAALGQLAHAGAGSRCSRERPRGSADEA